VTKTFKTALVIIPPLKLWEPVQAIRAKYDRHFNRWMPHITLIFPFREKHEFESLSEKFSQALEGIQPFAIELSRFAFFTHSGEEYTLWLKPEPAHPLHELQTQLWHVVPDCNDVRNFKHGFTPHLSVGQISGKKPMQELLHTLQKSWKPLKFVVSHVSIIWRNDPPDDIFRVYENIAVGGVKRDHSKN